MSSMPRKVLKIFVDRDPLYFKVKEVVSEV